MLLYLLPTFSVVVLSAFFIPQPSNNFYTDELFLSYSNVTYSVDGSDTKHWPVSIHIFFFTCSVTEPGFRNSHGLKRIIIKLMLMVYVLCRNWNSTGG